MTRTLTQLRAAGSLLQAYCTTLYFKQEQQSVRDQKIPRARSKPVLRSFNNRSEDFCKSRYERQIPVKFAIGFWLDIN
jgi:hypothetical protein